MARYNAYLCGDLPAQQERERRFILRQWRESNRRVYPNVVYDNFDFWDLYPPVFMDFGTLHIVLLDLSPPGLTIEGVAEEIHKSLMIGNG